jgi:hypothetical protein
MLNTRVNIRIINFDAVIVILILFFGILIYSNSVRSTKDPGKMLVSSFVSVSENNAISAQFIRLQVFQKTWISNKDHFNILAFNRNQLYENKKASLKLSHLQIIRQSSHKIPQFFLRYHLFPSEMDEPPVLS